MQASLVVPTYNSRDLLVACLVSLNHQRDCADGAFEVVLVDDGSTDGTGDLLAELSLNYPVRYHYLPRQELSSRSAARNAGIRAATGELIVFLDGDQVVDPLFVAGHLRAHRDRTDLVAIGFREYLEPGKVDLDALGRSFSPDALPPVAAADERAEVLAAFSENLAQLETRWHFLYGCNASVRKEHLLAVGGFDEEIRRWSFEDVELGYRLHRHGLTFVHNGNSRVYHQHHPESNAERYADWLFNFRYFKAKHPDLPVELQWVLDPYFDPARQDVSWFEAYLRFEYACRAVRGRLPAEAPYRVLVIDEESLPDAVAAVRAAVADGDLAVLDTTDDPDLAVLVQGIITERELRYFKKPGAELRARIEGSGRAGRPRAATTGV